MSGRKRSYEDVLEDLVDVLEGTNKIVEGLNRVVSSTSLKPDIMLLNVSSDNCALNLNRLCLYQIQSSMQLKSAEKNVTSLANKVSSKVAKLRKVVQLPDALELIDKELAEKLPSSDSLTGNDVRFADSESIKEYMRYTKKLLQARNTTLKNDNNDAASLRIKDFIAQNVDSEDFSVEEAIIEPICPISREVLKNPVRNSTCGHIYSKESIQNLGGNNSMPCPSRGCRSYIQPKALINDPLLEIRANEWEGSKILKDIETLQDASSVVRIEN